MKLSIITINYNNRDGLRKTIESVVNQTWRDFEYIIIDGGSKDGSVEVIKEFADRIDYWVSEPDKGIYDAMNKGIDKATGEYCLFMNSGDTIYETMTLEKVYARIDGADIICGTTITNQGVIWAAPTNISFRFLYETTINHQSTFTRSEILKRHKYDTSYKIVSDWKFLLECLIINNGSYKSINQPIALYDTCGISSLNKKELANERFEILSALIPERILNDYRASLESKLYRILTEHRLHKFFYTLTLFPFKIASLFSSKYKWAKTFPFKI